jgi:hypothetical protein
MRVNCEASNVGCGKMMLILVRSLSPPGTFRLTGLDVSPKQSYISSIRGGCLKVVLFTGDANGGSLITMIISAAATLMVNEAFA